MNKSVVTIFGVCALTLGGFFVINQYLANNLKTSSFQESDQVKEEEQGTPTTKVEKKDAENAGYLNENTPTNQKNTSKNKNRDEINNKIKQTITDKSKKEQEDQKNKKELSNYHAKLANYHKLEVIEKQKIENQKFKKSANKNLNLVVPVFKKERFKINIKTIKERTFDEKKNKTQKKYTKTL